MEGKPAQLSDGRKPVKMQSVAGQKEHPRRKNSCFKPITAIPYKNGKKLKKNK